MTKYEFQELAVDKFRQLKVGALFMKMGSGKTKVAVELANANADKVDRLLWVCPFQVKDSTKAELFKWSPKMPFNVIAYESISQGESGYQKAKDFIKGHRVFLVLDESIFIKNGRTKRWQRLKAIRRQCPYCIILNGTPVVRDEWDLYWQMQMLDERIIPYNEWDFQVLFFDQVRIRPKGRRHGFIKYEFSKKNARALAKMIEPYTFRVDVDYGIAVDDKTITVPPTGTTLSEYHKLRTEALQNLSSVLQFMGYLTQMLWQMAVDDNRCDKTVELAKGRPVIIYAVFKAEVDKLIKKLDGECYCIRGGMSADDRKRQLYQFEKWQDRPLIISYGTGSYGLNLQFANEVIFNSYDWNYGRLEQAKARVLRIGQANKVKLTFVENLDAKDAGVPIQRMVRACVQNKTEMSEFVKTELMNNRMEAWL